MLWYPRIAKSKSAQRLVHDEVLQPCNSSYQQVLSLLHDSAPRRLQYTQISFAKKLPISRSRHLGQFLARKRGLRLGSVIVNIVPHPSLSRSLLSKKHLLPVGTYVSGSYSLISCVFNWYHPIKQPSRPQFCMLVVHSYMVSSLE